MEIETSLGSFKRCKLKALTQNWNELDILFPKYLNPSRIIVISRQSTTSTIHKKACELFASNVLETVCQIHFNYVPYELTWRSINFLDNRIHALIQCEHRTQAAKRSCDEYLNSPLFMTASHFFGGIFELSRQNDIRTVIKKYISLAITKCCGTV